jgi:hypothetical protein
VKVMTEREVCPADMRHHGGHVWVRKTLFDVHVGVGDVIVTDVDIVCLDCNERRNIVCTTPIIFFQELLTENRKPIWLIPEEE